MGTSMNGGCVPLVPVAPEDWLTANNTVRDPVPEMPYLKRLTSQLLVCPCFLQNQALRCLRASGNASQEFRRVGVRERRRDCRPSVDQRQEARRGRAILCAILVVFGGRAPRRCARVAPLPSGHHRLDSLGQAYARRAHMRVCAGR